MLLAKRIKRPSQIFFVMDENILGHFDSGSFEFLPGFVFVNAGVDRFVAWHEYFHAGFDDLIAQQGRVINLEIILEMHEIGLLEPQYLEQAPFVLRGVRVRNPIFARGGRQYQVGGLATHPDSLEAGSVQ
ncbi:hypothetical protein WOC76_11220 [Methylocystis sp. IM3]|uniref:hypothetical protein n=1 Tax=Methylocystis sp. IM3 TaxID=3136722 RepID=UPI00311A5ADD